MAACGNCSTLETADRLLRKCGRCRSVRYCNHECQKSDWKRHKKDCAKLANANDAEANQPTDAPRSTTASAGAFKANGPHTKPFHAINENKFLHSRPEQQTFELLVDCLRLRQEDAYNFGGESMSGSIYDGRSKTSEKAFRRFVTKARKVNGFLPPWLTDAKIEECIEWAGGEGHGFSLAHAVKKGDIQTTWADPSMPMKLRMMAEKVYGYTPGGFESGDMMNMQLQMENSTSGGVASLFQFGL